MMEVGSGRTQKAAGSSARPSSSRILSWIKLPANKRTTLPSNTMASPSNRKNANLDIDLNRPERRTKPERTGEREQLNGGELRDGRQNAARSRGRGARSSSSSDSACRLSRDWGAAGGGGGGGGRGLAFEEREEAREHAFAHERRGALGGGLDDALHEARHREHVHQPQAQLLRAPRIRLGHQQRT